MKKILLLLIIIACGIFICLKIQVNGDQNSKFNRTTRFDLGKNRVVRSILGLHNHGDAREEYLKNSGPIVIEWFKPASDDAVDAPLQQFADLVSAYTGRTTKVVFGGGLSDGTVDKSDLATFSLKAGTDNGGSSFTIFFAKDYSPRPDQEISTTYGESGMIISMDAHKDFLSGYARDLGQYYLSSMLHEFGHQIGLEHNDDPACIMSAHAGIDGKPLEYYGKSEPQDYCQAEKDEINKLKSEYK